MSLMLFYQIVYKVQFANDGIQTTALETFSMTTYA
jgi:hypothetical protein